MIKKSIFIIAMIAAIFFYGNDSFALIIGPSRFEVRLPAKEIADIDYYVQNDTSNPIHVTVDPENWFRDVYNYAGLKISDWIKIGESEFDLNPKEIKKLSVTVKVPKEARGEIVAQIFFASAISETAGNAGGRINARLGAILYVAIKDTEKVKAEIMGIDVKNTGEGKAAQLKIDVAVQNEGNVHIRPASGILTIYDGKGQEAARINMPPEQSVLPGRTEKYSVVWDNPTLKEGNYSISCEIKYGKMYAKEKTAEFKKSFELDNAGKVIVK